MKAAEIRRLLPGIFQSAAARGTPIDALLRLMEQLHAPTEDRIASLDELLDPRRAPDDFVRFLATWVDLDPDLALGPERLRALVALGAELSRWRGTVRGLTAFLEVATGMSGFKVDDAVPDEQGRIRPFHLRVTAPAALAPYAPQLEAIVLREKPAYVTIDLPLTFA
jgi:phage tail-like protein